MKIIASLGILLFSLTAIAQKKTGRLEMLDPYAFNTKLIHMLGTLVDVRSPDEFNLGTIKGAKNLEWESLEFKEQAPNIAKYKPVFLFCQGGYRSGEAATWFLKNGFNSVIILENGYDAWKAFGFPTTEKEEIEHQAPGSYDPEK
ncbi:MAG: rhodanese-like domain-containing protein [Bacteroidia bacterium]